MSEEDNIAFLISGAYKTTFAQRPIPSISANDVLIAVKKTGICGSDMHLYLEGKKLGNPVTTPFALGHESSGIIIKVGENVESLKPGDRVAMEPGIYCGYCNACRDGTYYMCEFREFASTPPVDGTLKRYFKLPKDMVYKLPDNLTLEDGAMIEPLSVAVHAVSTIARLRINQRVAVFGAGPIGLTCMAVSRAIGASQVIAIDIVPNRLEFAKSYVATETFLPPKIKETESKIQYSRRAVNLMYETLGIDEKMGNGIDLVVDATGTEICAQMGIFLAKSGGTYIQVGMGADEAEIPITLLAVKELAAKGACRYGPGDYKLAIALVSSGKVDLKPLVSHRYKFEDAKLALETTRKGASEDGRAVIKVIISGPDVDPEEV